MTTEVTASALRDYLSFSQLKTMTDCGEKYRRKYIVGQPTDRNSVAAVAGGAFHAAVDEVERAIVDVESDRVWWEESNVKDRLVVVTNQQVNAEIEDLGIDPSELTFYGKQNLYYYRKTAIPRFAESYVKQRAYEAELGWSWPTVDVVPEFSELDCLVDLFNGHGLQGAIDQIPLDSSGYLLVRDVKTGKPKPEHAVQLHVYRYLLWRAHGIDPDYGQILYVNRSDPHPQVVKWDSSLRQIEEMLWRAYQMIDQQMFLVSGPFTDHCPICDFREDCPWGGIRVHGTS